MIKTTTVFILYIFTHVSSGSATHSQEYVNEKSCNNAINVISNTWVSARAKDKYKSLPDIEMMVCVPKEDK